MENLNDILAEIKKQIDTLQKLKNKTSVEYQKKFNNLLILAEEIESYLR